MVATGTAVDYMTKGVLAGGDVTTANNGPVQKALVGSVARTNTVAITLGTLPAGATVIGVTIAPVGAAVASNAGTSATVSVGFSGGTGVEILNAHDVKASGGNQQLSSGGKQGVLSTSMQTVVGIYAETGTPSTAGGPWQVVAEFITV